jgi:hypothetical protein
MLNWSSNFTENNLRIWKDQISMYAMREFGQLGLLFETNEYYVPPEVELPEMEDGSDPFSEANDPHGLELEDYKNQLKERRTAISKLEANKIPLYAFMMTKLSAQSKVNPHGKKLILAKMRWLYGSSFKQLILVVMVVVVGLALSQEKRIESYTRI